MAAAHALGVKKIDYLLITHYHGDHIGGFEGLLARIPIGTVIDHGDNRETTASTQPDGAADRHEESAAGFDRLWLSALRQADRQAIAISWPSRAMCSISAA